MHPHTAVDHSSELSGKNQSWVSSLIHTAPADSAKQCVHCPDDKWPIDYDFVRDHLGSLMEELMPDLIEVFFEDSVFRLHQLQASVNDRDSQEVLKTAHSLKGSSATLGMLAFSSLCLQLETAARCEDWNRIYSLKAQIHDEFARIQAFLTNA